MNIRRKNKSDVVYNGRIIAIDGEANHEETCEKTRALVEEGS